MKNSNPNQTKSPEPSLKRDMELVRLLLLRSEGDAKAQEPVEKYPVPQRAYHVALLKDAGFVEAIIRKDENDFPAAAKVLRLTWQGHEFLDLTRDDKVWRFVKGKVLKPGVSGRCLFSLSCLRLKRSGNSESFSRTQATRNSDPSYDYAG